MDDRETRLVPTERGELVVATGIGLLGKIRPYWQAKSLIQRVRRLLPHDPSSACQRLLNAAVQDLREKIVIAGIDIAKQAAVTHRLPPVGKAEDVIDAYSTQNILDLAYHMGLLNRPEWKRMRRAYEIRRDLEHEDDEYEAGVEDCVYIFTTCIEIVLSRDPSSPCGSPRSGSSCRRPPTWCHRLICSATSSAPPNRGSWRSPSSS